jgi:hypothetical protein
MFVLILAASVSQGQTCRAIGSGYNRTLYAEPDVDRTATDRDIASRNARVGGVNPHFEFLTKIGEGLLNEFFKAWAVSGAGMNGREGVVLIFRMADGSYTGRSQGISNEYHRFTFKWRFNAVAIVHTHPNSSDPKPGEHDKRVADKYCVPNFTITLKGMYVYDPVTRTTSKVLNGLDWLKLSTYPDELGRGLGT